MGLFVNGLFSQKKKYTKETDYSVTWHDGRTKRRLKIIPDLIAEFSTNPPLEKINIKKADPKAVLISRNSGIHIWRINKQTIKESLKKGKIPTAISGDISLVFKDSSGRKRALPGNIIVYMDKSWPADKIYKWAKRRNLIVIKRISLFHNSYLIKTPAGIASLNISNSLIGTPGVISASPNWWKEAAPR